MDAQAATERWETRADDESFAVAARALEVALTGGPDPGLLVGRGFIHEMRAANDLREAARWYERALELDPSFELAHYQLVGAYLSLRQAHDVSERYEQRIAADPSDVLASRERARHRMAAA